MTTTAAIQFRDATKQYRHRGRAQRALDGTSFSIQGPGVHGLLGPNGAGKTTALRALLGLIRLTSGQCLLLGEQPGPRARRVLSETGSLIETPRFPTALSGKRVLQVHGALLGVPSNRVDEILAVIGLAERAHDRVGGYSLGMRQRLALGVALLGEPRVLLLDEPANGLDPGGMRDLRALLRKVADRGAVVVFSSHVLSEVEQVCDTVTVLRDGRCVHHGTIAQIRATGATVVRTVASPHATLAALQSAGLVASLHGDEVEVLQRGAPPGQIARVLATAGLDLLELRPLERSLDEAFAEITAVGEAAPSLEPAVGHAES